MINYPWNGSLYFALSINFFEKNILYIVANKYYFSKSITRTINNNKSIHRTTLGLGTLSCLKNKKFSSYTWYSRDDPYTSYGSSSESCIRKDERIKPQTRVTSASIKAWWECVLFEMWNCNCSERLPGLRNFGC